jgi:hypothetical protein
MQVAKIMAGPPRTTRDASILYWFRFFAYDLASTRIIPLEGNSSSGELLKKQPRLRRRSIELMHGGGEWLREEE